jgi:hypothetical protein
VIRGSTRLLEDTQFVIAEVGVQKRFEGSYSFEEFISLMGSCGFRLCDILDTRRLPGSREIQYLDAMFRRGA